MHFLVGLDLGHRSQGAVHFAAWLHRHGGHTLTGIHVLERVEASLAVKYSVHSALEVTKFAETAIHETLRAADVREDFGATTVELGETTETSLAARCTTDGADAVIIGRAAPSDAAIGPRLGRVARRMLRSLPIAVAVAPPTLVTHDIAAGPVLVATDLRPHSIAAARFGQRIAESLDRPLRLVHVAPEHSELGPAYLPASVDLGVKASYDNGVRQRATAWQVESGLSELPLEVEFGRPVERLIGTAARLGSPFIVCGSRRLSLTDRIFQVSTASRLAAIAPCAVLVVPPEP